MLFLISGNFRPYTNGFMKGGITTNSSDKITAMKGFRDSRSILLRAT